MSSHVQEGLTNLVLKNLIKAAPTIEKGRAAAQSALAAKGDQVAAGGIATALPPRRPDETASARETGEAALLGLGVFENLISLVKEAAPDKHATFSSITGTRSNTFEDLFTAPA